MTHQYRRTPPPKTAEKKLGADKNVADACCPWYLLVVQNVLSGLFAEKIRLEHIRTFFFFFYPPADGEK